jgi:hypothetical protein
VCSPFPRRGALSRRKVAALPATREEAFPFYIASLAANRNAPGSLDRHAHGQRCRSCCTTHMAYDISQWVEQDFLLLLPCPYPWRQAIASGRVDENRLLSLFGNSGPCMMQVL